MNLTLLSNIAMGLLVIGTIPSIYTAIKKRKQLEGFSLPEKYCDITWSNALLYLLYIIRRFYDSCTYAPYDYFLVLCISI